MYNSFLRRICTIPYQNFLAQFQFSVGRKRLEGKGGNLFTSLGRRAGDSTHGKDIVRASQPGLSLEIQQRPKGVTDSVNGK